MMGVICEELVGFLYNFEVEVIGVEGEVWVVVCGFGGFEVFVVGFSYFVFSVDVVGEVEVCD